MTEIITPKEAQSLYREITGHSITLNGIDTYARKYPHIGYFVLTKVGKKRLKGIKEKRFANFVKIRSIDGAKNPSEVFDDSGMTNNSLCCKSASRRRSQP